MSGRKYECKICKQVHRENSSMGREHLSLIERLKIEAREPPVEKKKPTEKKSADK